MCPTETGGQPGAGVTGGVHAALPVIEIDGRHGADMDQVAQQAHNVGDLSVHGARLTVLKSASKGTSFAYG